MTPHWLRYMNEACPLGVLWVAWEDPTLVIRGSDWAFTCTSPWRVIERGRLIGGCEHPNAGEVVDELRQLEIVRAEPLTSLNIGDLSLVFSNGYTVQVFVASLLDPWVFRPRRGPTIVPSPSDPGWATD